MLRRLFPHHSISMLQTVLVSCNKDPVRTIEKLLDRRVPVEVTKKEISLTMRRASSLSPVSVHSIESTTDRKQNYNLGINDDQLSSLAKAYDIPVNEDKIQRKSLAW